MRCSTHCPPSGSGLAATVAGVAIAAVAAAVFVATHLWLVLGCAVLTAAGAYGFQRVLLRFTVLEMPGRGPAVSRAALPAPVPAQAATAPRAVEAPRRVIPGVVISSEISEREVI